MSNLTAAAVMLVFATLLIAAAIAGFAIHDAMKAAGAKCEYSDQSYKCRLEW